VWLDISQEKHQLSDVHRTLQSNLYIQRYIHRENLIIETKIDYIVELSVQNLKANSIAAAPQKAEASKKPYFLSF
jgi:hypothetical protein